jgi:hypothetical protein
LGFKVFNIYNYRLKDLCLIISFLDELVKDNITNGKQTDYIEMTIDELNKLKKMIINKMSTVKYVIEHHEFICEKSRQTAKL